MSLSLTGGLTVAPSSSAPTPVAATGAAAFNKKLFTNFGRTLRPVKRLAKQESAIFGGPRKSSVASVAAASQRAPAKRASARSVTSANAVVTGRAPASSNVKTHGALSVAATSSSSMSPTARFVGWKNYTNLLNLTDGLKHQLPNFGYELYLPFVVRLLFDSTESSSSFEHLINRHSNSSSSVGGHHTPLSRTLSPTEPQPSTVAAATESPHCVRDQLNVVLGDFTGGNTLSEVHRRDWTALYKRSLLPVLKILCSGYRDRFRPTTKNYLTSTFALNRQAKRWDMLLNQACETSNVVVQHERENEFARSSFATAAAGLSFSIHEEEDHHQLLSSSAATAAGSFATNDDQLPLSAASTTSLAKYATRDSSAALVKFFQDLRNATTVCTTQSSSAVSADEVQALLEQMVPTSGGLSLDGPCACCLMSPVVLVRAPLLEDAQQMQQFARSCTSVVLSMDASTFLCGHMPPDSFAENFTLKHVLRSSVPAGVDHDVAKTAYVSSLTYFERLFAVQFVVAVLVEWCWTRHRLTHAVLQGNNCNYDSLPPVTLVMHQRLFDIVDQMPTVCLQSLARERKYVYHIVT